MSSKFFKDLKKSLEEVIAHKEGKLDLYSEYIEVPEQNRIMKRIMNYEDNLLEILKNSEEALAYLNAAFMDEDQEVFLLALKHVLKAQGVDISAFAEETHIIHQNIYYMLSRKGNPRWHNFRSIIDAMGLQFKLEAKHK